MRRITVPPEEKHIEIFYVKPKNVYENKFVLTGDEFHHAKNVLRKKKGDIITVVDGIGNEYVGIIDEIHYDNITGSISKILRKPREPILDVTILQGLIKGNRFKYFVEKSTEIGVNRIIPIYTERSISKNLEKDKKRWENIAISAMKQSGRSILPEIFDVCSFKEGVDKVEKYDLKLVAHPEHKQGVKSLEKNILIEIKKRKDIIKTVAVAVGPEGGFTLDEIEYAKSKNFFPINLGERRLRSETASIVALTILLFSEDDL
jgi:16S rRNA (uracil1498-N3)-methyltransferase